MASRKISVSSTWPSRISSTSINLAGVVLVVLLSGCDGATVRLTGTTTATASSDAISLTCSYTLATNETARTLTVTRGNDRVLSWTLTGTASATSPWTLFNSSVSNRMATVQLPAASVTKDSGGTYTCTVVTVGTSAGSHPETHVVNVHYVPIVTISGDMNVVEGQGGRKVCSAQGKPSPTFKWMKGTAVIANGATLTLSNIQRNQAGNYECKATNSVGEGKKESPLNVYYLDPPRMSMSTETAVENGSVTIDCTAVSNPVVTLTVVGPRRSNTATGPLTYTFNAGCLDAGDYQCSAKNANIKTPKKVTKKLRVLCKPRNDTATHQTEFVKNLTETAVFKATVMADPSPTFQWTRKVTDTGEVMDIRDESGHFVIRNTDTMSQLSVKVINGDDYAEYSLKASNSQGETTLKYYLRSLTVPFQVSSLEMASVTTDSITVKWISSFNGGAEQHYQVQYQPMTDSQQNEWTQKSAQIDDPGRRKTVYATISDIHPSRTYRVRIFSSNMFGQSLYSNEIDVTTEGVLPFGVGVAVGLVVSIVVAALIIGGIFLYKRKVRPLQKGKQSNSLYENRAYNNQGSVESTAPSGGGFYSALDGTREKPPTYDALDRAPEQPVYQNVERRDNAGAEPSASQAEPSTPEVYMNYNPKNTEKKSKFRGKQNPKKKEKNKNKYKEKPGPQQEVYENSVINDKTPDSYSKNNHSDGQVYANT